MMYRLIGCMSLLLLSSAQAESPAEKTDANKPSADVSTPFKAKLRFHEDLYPSLRWQDESAWQPPKSHLYVGLWNSSYAPTSWLNLSTWNIPWIARMPSVDARVAIWQNRKWAVGSSLGLIHINMANLANLVPEEETEETPSSSAENEAPITFQVIPFSLYGSYRLGERFVLSMTLRHYTIAMNAETSDSELSFQGGLATDNTHVRLQLGVALSSKWSVWLISNQLLYQGARGYTYSKIDIEGGGTVEVYFKARSDMLNFADANAQGFRLVRRGKRSLLSLGLDKGKVPLYSLGFVPDRSFTLPYLSWGLQF